MTEYINLEETRRRAEAEQGRILAEIKRRGDRDTTGESATHGSESGGG
ncbi:hypothetical protein [Amycolatopsis sp.]|nr:hypothetical protein [Amycolatopsis sp.]